MSHVRLLLLACMFSSVAARGGEPARPSRPAASARSLAAQRRDVWRAIYPDWKPGESIAAHARALDDQIAKLHLEVVDNGAKQLSGATVKMVVQANGQKFVAKERDARLRYEREHFAVELRRAADEPTVTAAAQTVKLPTGRVVPVYVKPFIPASGALPASPRAWTPAQRSTILAEHAWAEFLGNYDTKNEQSLVLDQPSGQKAVNIDWDVALSDYAKNQPISRFKHYSPVNRMPWVPPAHSLLYRDFVHGKIELDFTATFDAIGRIEKLSDDQIRQAIAPFLDQVFAAPGAHVGPYRDREALVKAVLARRDGLRAEFTAFVGTDPEHRAPGSLLAERDHYLRTHGASELAHPKALLLDVRNSEMAKLGDTPLVPKLLRGLRKLKGE